ncbi:MAG TPA: type IV secretion system protein [Streptosporangiaceae bacterium]|nr:type IV secretion system protein [Streptosporangiaceae bacterium]
MPTQIRRIPRKLAVALIAAAAVCCVPLAASAAVVSPRALAGSAPARTAAEITPMGVVALRAPANTALRAPGWTAAQPIPARTLAATAPAGGGLCSVPGIGDIGGLFGFCSLGQSGITGELNNLCQPGVPQPESATSGIDSLIKPPAASGKPVATPYNQYGMAGQYWAATNLQCSDMTSLIGNDVAGMIFDFAKALDRVTITVYQSAAGEGILSWLQDVTDHLITGLGNAIYFPYVAVIVILGAIWLAWQGLIRKRATRTIEGTIWMVVACAAAIWLIGRPADFTGLGKGVSDGISTTLNAAFAHLPSPGQAACLPVTARDPQISPASFSYTSGRTVVDQNANELWTVLVCKPWLDGEFGTTVYAAKHGAAQTAVSKYARPLLWAQAIAVNERATTGMIQAKQAAYVGIAQTIQNKDPSAYPLFQGKEWTTRLEIAFASLLAAVVAGVLILLISVTLILLKLGFLLLLIVGPFFLLIGTHPGFGRVVAVRWFEMLVGVLLKQAAVALALSVLLYSYALIMGTSDAVLPWALKILMITLVTVAVFIYRKPFQHLFTSVGYSAIGATDRADADLSRAAATARANTRTAATLAVPGFAGYRVARWARRNPAQAAGLALSAATAVNTAGLAAGAAAGGTGVGAEAGQGAGETAGAGTAGAGTGADSAGAGVGSQAGTASRARAYGASAGNASGDQAPPLRLPASNGTPSSWVSSGAGAGAGAAAGGGSVAGSVHGAGGSAGSPPVSAAASDQRWPGGSGGGWTGAGSPPTSRRPAGSRNGAGPTGAGAATRGGTGPGPGPSSWAGSGESASAHRPTSQPTGTFRSRASAPPRSGAGSGAGAVNRPVGPSRSSAQPPRPAPPPRSSAAGSSSGSSASPRTPGLFRSLGSRRQPPAAPPRQGPSRGSAGWISGDQAAGGQPGSQPRSGEEQAEGPFWLRPIRRQK